MNFKFKSYGDILEIHIPIYLGFLLDFLDYKIRSKFKNTRLGSGGYYGDFNFGEKSKKYVSIDYKWLDSKQKTQIKKFVKDFFGNYIKLYNPKDKMWD